MNSNLSDPQPSITSGFRTAARVMFSGRGFFALPILLVCIFAEIVIQWGTLSYEQQSAPPNVPKFLGLSLWGMIILITEVFKLPMAFWGASLSGWRRVFCNVGILFLCVVTWATIKDIGYNDSNAALASARLKSQESQRLQEDVEALDRRLVALKNNDASTRAAIAEEISQKNDALDRLEKEADDEIKIYEKSRDLELKAAIDPSTRERIEGLQRDRVAESDRYKGDLERFDQEIAQVERANQEATDRVDEGDALALEAWQKECERMDAAHAKRVDQASRDFAAAESSFRERIKEFDARRTEYEARRREVEASFERKRTEHEANDTAFYDKPGKIAADRKSADNELARLEADFAQIAKPTPPVRETSIPPQHPPRPANNSDAKGAIDVLGLKAQRDERKAERDRADLESGRVISGLRDDAAQKSGGARVKVQAALDRLAEQHNVAMARIREDRERARRAAEEVRALRDATQMEPLAIQAEILKIPDEQQRISRDISRLKSEAELELTDSYPGRMGQFLGYFMRESSQEVRIQAVLSIFIPIMALIAAFAPASVLEVVIHGLIIHRSVNLPKRKRKWWETLTLGGRALRRERGLNAARALAIAAREGAADALQQARVDEHAQRLADFDAARSLLDTAGSIAEDSLAQRVEAFGAEMAARRSELESEVAAGVLARTNSLAQRIEEVESRRRSLDAEVESAVAARTSTLSDGLSESRRTALEREAVDAKRIDALQNTAVEREAAEAKRIAALQQTADEREVANAKRMEAQKRAAVEREDADSKRIDELSKKIIEYRDDLDKLTSVVIEKDAAARGTRKTW